MIERFSVRISTPAEREKALSKIFQAVLLGPVALVTTAPRRDGGKPKGVFVVHLAHEESHQWVDDMIELEPDRVLGNYTYTGDHRGMLSLLAEDLEEASRELA